MFWKKKRVEKQIKTQIGYEDLAKRFIENNPNGRITEVNGQPVTSLFDFIADRTTKIESAEVETSMVYELLLTIAKLNYYKTNEKDGHKYFYKDVPYKDVCSNFVENCLSVNLILYNLFQSGNRIYTSRFDKDNILYFHHGIVEIEGSFKVGRVNRDSWRSPSNVDYVERKMFRKRVTELLKDNTFFHQLIMRVFNESDKDFIIHSPECSYIINAKGKSAIIMMNGGTMDIIIEENNSYIITWDLIEKIEWRTGKLDIKKLRNPS